MELMPEEVRRLLPPLYANEEKKSAEVKVPLKLFDPCGLGTWFITEFDGKDIMFGYCVSPLGPDCDELGYMSLKEIEEVVGPLGVGIKRDLWWNPETTLDKVMSGEVR